MTDLPITSIAALLNGGLLLALTARVIFYRRRNSVILGDNGDRALTKAIRGQANAAEQMPMALILCALAEAQGAPILALAVTAALFTLGRYMHGAYFAWHGLHWRLRFWGMLATLAAQGLLLALLAVALVS
ncbi:MAPEG family protein [Roseovarius sp. SYSU LYC5161]|uniref:MAPEG family protein n=1 Tax=Roseovarius halophilus (ex Wu et al. 2025) TaxID=3376060 RepID=UPI003999911F